MGHTYNGILLRLKEKLNHDSYRKLREFKIIILSKSNPDWERQKGNVFSDM